MTSIKNNYEKILKEMIFNQFSENFKQKQKTLTHMLLIIYIQELIVIKKS